jgi:hypothetical protein
MTAYFAFFGFGGQTLTGRGEPERLMAVDVGPRFFEVLGVQPASGRLFIDGEHRRVAEHRHFAEQNFIGATQ